MHVSTNPFLLKYVITVYGEVFFFHLGQGHDDSKCKKEDVASAGFVRIDEQAGNLTVQAFGESQTLGAKSHPEIDENILIGRLIQ